MELLKDIFVVAVYSVMGSVFMLVGNFLIDLIVPCHFPTEIKKGNKAVGWLSAGSFAGVGIILRAAIMSPSGKAVEETLFSGMISSAVYFAVGIVFFIAGYLAINVFHRKYNLNDEIGKGNEAAGIMVLGIFVGLAAIISGVIYG